jgi:hypothetical protein
MARCISSINLSKCHISLDQKGYRQISCLSWKVLSYCAAYLHGMGEPILFGDMLNEKQMRQPKHPKIRQATRLLTETGIAQSIYRIGYELDFRAIGFQFPAGTKIFCVPYHPNRLWGPPSLIPNVYWGLLPREKATGAWSWPIHSSYVFMLR